MRFQFQKVIKLALADQLEFIMFCGNMYELNPSATTLNTSYKHECHLNDLEQLHPPSLRDRVGSHLPLIYLHVPGFTHSFELTMVLQLLSYLYILVLND
jgi:hypothetical protein